MRRAIIQGLPGLTLAAALAGAAILLASISLMQHAGFSALTLAILGGILLGNTVFKHIERHSDFGVRFAKGELLRLGIILYGFRITFQQIAGVGLAGVLIDALVLCSTFFIAYQLGTRVFGLDRHTSILIGAGSSICGAAAILATEPVVKARADKVTVAISTVVIFGSIAMFLYPMLYRLNLHGSWLASGRDFGIFSGATIHEVAQVVAAGREMGEAASSAAVITKMIRVMMLAPFLLALSFWLARTEGAEQVDRGSIRVPWFAVFFVVVAGFNSLQLLPGVLVEWVQALDTFLLAMAMAALGLHTRIGAIRQAGTKPILLAGLLFLWLLAGGSAISHVVQTLL